jgi:disulfide bond formation protein DsbB
MKHILALLQKQNFKMLTLLIFIISSAAVISAFFAEYILGLKPCNLCLYQRLPYYLVILLSGGAYILSFYYNVRKFTLIILQLIGTAFLGNALLALYAVGVERKIFDLPASCASAKLPADITTAEQLTAYLMTQEFVSCDQPTILLFNISMAELNALFCLSYACFIFYMIYRKHD